ncbi:MAG: hypothetical protein HOF84_03845, partial [Rhodospirillales bacterium]|nr:hypothetical protein [Rhodospirillales bacterium]
MDNNDNSLGLEENSVQDGSSKDPFGGSEPNRVESTDGPFGAGGANAEAGARSQQVLVAQASEQIGTIDEIAGQVTVTRADGTEAVLSKGAAIFQGDSIETGAGAAVGIVFVDATTFSLGESGSMVIDEMVYDPAAQEGSMAATITQGVFSFVSGQISKSGIDEMTLTTPVATIGIRGTTGAGQAGAEGTQNSISLLPDAGGSLGEMTITTQSGAPQVISSVGQTVSMTSAFLPPPAPIVLTPAQIQQTYGSALSALPTPPPLPEQQQEDDQAAGEEGEDADGEGEGEGEDGAEVAGEGEGEPEQPPETPDIGELLPDPQTLAAALQQGDEIKGLFESVIRELTSFLDQPFFAPVDPNQFLAGAQLDAGPNLSSFVQRFASVVQAAADAAKIAGDAEDAAAAKVGALSAELSVKMTASTVGLTSTQSQSLAEVLTAPMKALGAAGAISATASAISKAALAAAAQAGSGVTVGDDVIKALEDAVGLSEGAATNPLLLAANNAKLIVEAAISAADTVLANVIIAAKAAKTNGDNAATILSSAQTKAATDYGTEVTTALNAAQASIAVGDRINLADLSEIVNSVSTQVTAISTAVSADPLSAGLATVVAAAETAAQKADLTAERAENTMTLTDPTQVLAEAALALTAAGEAETARAAADAAVDFSQLAALLDPSAAAVFLQLQTIDLAAELESTEATSAIAASTGSLEAAGDFIDLTAQNSLDAAKTVATAAAGTRTTEQAEAVAAAESVVDLRVILVDKLVTEAVKAAELQSLNEAKATGDARTETAQLDVNEATLLRDAAQTAFNDATAAAGAAPTDTDLSDQATLKQQVLANAQAVLDFTIQIKDLFQAATDRIQNRIDTEAQAAADDAATAAQEARDDVTEAETAAAAELSEALTAITAAAAADKAVAIAEGFLSVAKAAAVAQADAILDVAVENVQDLATAASVAAANTKTFADEAKRNADDSPTSTQAPNKIAARAAEDAADNALFDVVNSVASEQLIDTAEDLGLTLSAQTGAAAQAALEAQQGVSEQALITFAEGQGLTLFSQNASSAINALKVQPGDLLQAAATSLGITLSAATEAAAEAALNDAAVTFAQDAGLIALKASIEEARAEALNAVEPTDVAGNKFASQDAASVAERAKATDVINATADQAIQSVNLTATTLDVADAAAALADVINPEPVNPDALRQLLNSANDADEDATSRRSSQDEAANNAANALT